METYCRRIEPERNSSIPSGSRLVRGSQTALLTYLPLVALAPATTPLVSVQARYIKPRRGEYQGFVQEEVWWAFSLPGSWTTLDPTTIDWVDDGSLTLPCNVMGLPYNEIAVTYTAGLGTIPDAVKSACALIVKNAQASPGMNVKSSRIDMMQVQYFSDSMVDSTVRTLLRPWVANRLG